MDEGDPRVLLLNIKDESASGANLTLANHAIFVHPLLAASQQEYNACETQAIGRIRRFGQTNTVHLHRFLVLDTVDTETHCQRQGEAVTHEMKVCVHMRAPRRGHVGGGHV